LSALHVLILFFCLILTTSPVAAKKKGTPGAEPFAVIGGTAYRPPGLSLPGVRVRVRREPSGNSDKLSLKPIEVVSDARGEFAIRVPAVPSKWIVDVSAKGYKSESKSVTIEGEQRLELSFVLEPEVEKK
jgi:hypothetical protein